MSLAGAQDKVALRIENGEVCVPLGGAPSAHILKPASERLEGVVFNEALCMQLASAIGLPIKIVHPVSQKVAALIHQRSENVLNTSRTPKVMLEKKTSPPDKRVPSDSA